LRARDPQPATAAEGATMSGETAQLTIAAAPAQEGAGTEARCAGSWTVHGIGGLEREIETLAWPARGEVVIDGSEIALLDTSGAWLLHRTAARLEQQGCAVRVEGLRPEFGALLELVAAQHVLARSLAVPAPGRLARLGRYAWGGVIGSLNYLSFVGESFIVFVHALGEPHRVRWRVVLHNVQSAGVDALPITGLLSFLMGIVIAYQGAAQLEQFGANIFVVDLVALAMLRELSPLLTAIIIAGRSGSAYTAQIGTMKVTEEIDALRTIGVAPQELLVLPKTIALIIVMPLLTVYTDVTGVLGGMLMARWKLGISYEAFMDRLDEAISLSSYWTGLIKAPIFAMIVALVGCYRGFRVTGSAESVGTQTTMSVVQSIFLVIATDAVFSIVFNFLDL
jgi:phospholipid/cholesterol/gamma-HCH transport system permease protein